MIRTIQNQYIYFIRIEKMLIYSLSLEVIIIYSQLGLRQVRQEHILH